MTEQISTDTDAKSMPATLLLGPSGAGKTPLGEYLEVEGWQGAACRHLDFGAALRRIAAESDNEASDVLAPVERQRIRWLLERHALMEAEDAGLIRKILGNFIKTIRAQEAQRIVLNGLPRHVEQAKMIEDVVDVDEVVFLAAERDVVQARISENSGGDRVGRTDDSRPAIQGKLKTFDTRTVPLLDHYQANRVRIRRIEVGVTTQPVEIVRRLLESESS